MQRALSGAVAGRGGALDIVGPVGIGKSRLIREFSARCRDARTVQMRGAQYLSGTAYAGVLPLLRELTGIPLEADTTTVSNSSDGCASTRNSFFPGSRWSPFRWAWSPPPAANPSS